MSTSKIGARIVGPAAPAAHAALLDQQDAEGLEYENWASMREVVVSLGKRYGTSSARTPSRPKKTKSGKPRRKARVRKGANPPSANRDLEDTATATHLGVQDQGTLDPPYDFEVLCQLFENSSALRQNIDAMITNVDGMGHRFEPLLDFDAPGIADTISDLLVAKRLGEVPDVMQLTSEDFAKVKPGIDETEETRQLWKAMAAVERERIASFFDHLNPLEPLVEVRKRTRLDLEVLGNAAWEIMREEDGDPGSKITQVYHVPFVNMRLVRADNEATTRTMTVRRNRLDFETIEVDQYFRRYVRISGQQRVYYKEFGDPRVMSRATGKTYESLEVMRSSDEEGPEAQPANELYHWKIPSPLTSYGVPRWISALLAVLGSRAAEEVNFLYFDNKTIPPMVLLVSGGRLSENSVGQIEDYIKDRIKGRSNFHKIMVIEGIPAGADPSEGDVEVHGKMRVEFKPLLDAQMQDALFQQYDANNILKIGRAFRQPQILTGDTRDMNRSTAQVAKAFAEEQVYQPERDGFDAVMNRHFVSNLKIHFWRFKTNAPVQRIPNELIENVKKALDAGAITPNEARVLINDAFSIDLPYRSEDWGDVPPKLAQVAARNGGMVSAEVTGTQTEDVGSELEGEPMAASEGVVVARGRSAESDGHSHGYVALRLGDMVRFAVMPAGEDSHMHAVEEVTFKDGASIEVTLKESGGHSHLASVTFPVSKARKRASSFLGLLNGVRSLVEEEVASAQDEFFNGDLADSSEE